MSCLQQVFQCGALLLTVTLGMPSLRPSMQQIGLEVQSQNALLETTVPEFELHDGTVLDGLWKLARGPVEFGFGFEKVLKTNLSDPEIPDPRFNLHIRDKPLREVLDALCDADPRYMWSNDGATVNFYPRAIVNDSSYLLNRRFQKFDLKGATEVQDGLLAIARQLSPPTVEQIAQAQLGGDDPYPPEPWTLILENVTVRQVVNRLAAHGGPRGIWIFGGSKDFRAFGFFNTRPSPWLEKPKESEPRNP